MKKAIFAFLLALSVQGQGTIIFSNRGLSNYNNTATYNAPIFRYPSGGQTPAGGGLVAGLFKESWDWHSSESPVALVFFRDDGANAKFFRPSSTIATIPGILPGEKAILTVAVWEHGAGFTNSHLSGAWSFESKPLGGTNAQGVVFPTPTMGGWGPESGTGFSLPSPLELVLWPNPCADPKVFIFKIDSYLQVSWNTCTNRNYQFQSRSFESGWTNVGSVFAGDGYHMGKNFSVTDSESAFFRVITVP